jgi:hypothetical protein
MRKLLVAGVVLALVYVVPAEAGESYLGQVFNADAGTGVSVVSNLTTATPFVVAPRSKVTVQPSANAFVCVDSLAKLDAGVLLSDGGVNFWAQYRVPTCTSTTGVRIDSNVAFPTSCSSSPNPLMPDGGGVNSCTISCVPVSGSTVTCTVWQRIGDEGP